MTWEAVRDSSKILTSSTNPVKKMLSELSSPLAPVFTFAVLVVGVLILLVLGIVLFPLGFRLLDFL